MLNTLFNITPLNKAMLNVLLDINFYCALMLYVLNYIILLDKKRCGLFT